MATNPYTALGVESTASQDQIKTAYRKLAKKFHPDLNPGNKKAESQFKDISSAYDLIGNVEDRAKFDRGEVEAAEHRAGRSRGPFYSDTQSDGGRYTGQFDGIDEDILRSFFSQGGRQGQRGSRARASRVRQVYPRATCMFNSRSALPTSSSVVAKILKSTFLFR